MRRLSPVRAGLSGIRHELVWLTAVAGGYATLVTSGWQNTNMDRYLSWTMPTLLLFAVRMETAMEKGASVGALCNCSMAYALSPRRFVHLAGVYSPEMRVPIGTSAFDKLKNEPRHRFAYWYDEGFLGKVLDSGESVPSFCSSFLKFHMLLRPGLCYNSRQ